MEFDARERAVLKAIATATGPWIDAGHITRAAHIHSRRVLERLEAKGVVAAWRGDGNGRVFRRARYSFSPLGAYQFNVRLDELADGLPRWFPGLDASIDVPLRYHGQPGESRLRWPEQVVDHRKGPAEYVADLDAWETTRDPRAATKLFGRPIPVGRVRGKPSRTSQDAPRRAHAGGHGRSLVNGHTTHQGGGQPHPCPVSLRELGL